MIPLKDDVPSRTAPFVTVSLIVLNVLVFLYQFSLSMAGDAASAKAAEEFVYEFGAIPCRLTGSCPTPGDFPAPIVTVLTSMFVHGGVFHLGGNMLYLWIFGDNVEDTLGHGRFLVFYTLSGFGAAAAQIAMDPGSSVPMVGASGAISGVLGAYLLLFPYASVLTLVTFGFFIRFIQIPAVLVLGFWIVVQFLNGYLSHVAAAAGQTGTGGVAWFAHIGGFVAGVLLLFLLRPRPRARL
ncbi:MAG: rhomboid family intramembrane serine protease [Candidatus Rokubacteria bacterium]|nr:rhomboid family intramembrane serine protease [Candidatus Rokubacteria bacterium]MBI3827780.1 rhomboid family intramembrane serine protease [Candidatus Rokubacteria bacterium]